MKNNILNKFKYYIAISALAACLLVGAGFIFASPAYATTDIDAELFLPQSAMEYYDLTSPIDGFLWEENAAIIQGNNTLLVYYNGEYATKQLNTPQQVKKLSDDSLIVSDDGSLYKINYKDLSVAAEPLLANTSEGQRNIGGNYFDINDDYLITAFGTTINIYSIENGTITQADKLTDKIDASTPVCISADNVIFYVYQSNIYKYSVSGKSDTLIASKNPSAMTTLGGHLYYSEGATIYRVPVNGGESIALNIDESDYELGELTRPTSICVKNGKLIITDNSLNAIQEFKIDDANDKLVFTGFAIAKGKTAFNRVDDSVYVIEKYDDKIMAIDENKITVVINGTDKNFQNRSLTDVGIVPTHGALGKTTALVTDGTTHKLLDATDNRLKELKTVDEIAGTVKDVCYQTGRYILIAYDGTSKSTVYSLQENGYNLTAILTDIEVGNKPLIAADNLGNVYIADNTGTIKLYYPDGEGYSVEDLALSAPVVNPEKISVDLVGGIYILTENGTVTRFDGENETEYRITSDITAKRVTSFAMDSVSDGIYMIANCEELILCTTKLDNVSLQDYTGQNIFEPLDYVKNKSAIESAAPTQAFVTTDVDLYFLPLITENGKFSKTVDGARLRLSAKTSIMPISKITFDECEFYRVFVSVNDTAYYGYVPVNFTVTVLSEDINSVTFTVGKVYATSVFRDAALNDEIYSLTENSQVKIITTIDGVAKIAYKIDNEWLIGYVSADAIIDTPNTVIRNVLVILAVATSLTITSLYFIHKRKN